MPYDPGEVVEVIRGPRDNPAAGTYRAFAAACIRVVAAENTPENRVSAGERYAAVYEINLSRCIFCGYCEIACPFDAITMGHDYELADYNRSDLIFTKEMLLAEPLERTEFVAAAQVIVYAGAVMVLYVFVVAYVGGLEPLLAGGSGRGLKFVSAFFALCLFVELSIALIGTGL